jgi:hypothetical protein
MGSLAGGDHFGIVAEIVGAVKIGGTLLGLTPGIDNDNFTIGITGDFNVDEI